MNTVIDGIDFTPLLKARALTEHAYGETGAEVVIIVFESFSEELRNFLKRAEILL